MTERYLTVQQAADRIGVERRTISRLIKRGELRATHDPTDLRLRLIPLEDIERVAAVRRART